MLVLCMLECVCICETLLEELILKVFVIECTSTNEYCVHQQIPMLTYVWVSLFVSTCVFVNFCFTIFKTLCTYLCFTYLLLFTYYLPKLLFIYLSIFLSIIYLPTYLFIYYLPTYLPNSVPINLLMKKIKIRMLLYTLTKKFMEVQGKMHLV